MREKVATKLLTAVLAAVMVMGSVSGCGAKSGGNEESTQTQEKSGQEAEPAQEAAPEETAPAEPAPEETAPAAEEAPQETAPAPEAPDQPKEPEQETPAAPEEKPGEETEQELWPDGKFALNGVSYELPIPQASLAEAGWTVRFENTQNPGAFKMQPGAIINAELSLAGYEEAMVVTAEFENTGTETILLGECPLTALYITAADNAEPMPAGASSDGSAPENGISSTEEQGALYLPVLEIAPGITWGSTAEEITAAFGEPTFSGSGASRFDSMYENTSFYLEFLGEPDRGMRQLIYCIN